MQRKPVTTVSYWFLAVIAASSAGAFDCRRTGPVTACVVDLSREVLQLFHGDESGQPLRRFAALQTYAERRGQRVLLAMNAGMYEPDRSPVGLLVMGGRELYPLNTRVGSGNFYFRPNGVFLLTAGRAHVVATDEYASVAKGVALATQSGPLLVRDGQLHPEFNNRMKSRNIRNGIGVRASGEVVLAISRRPLTLYEFARVFRDRLNCPDALYLDGHISRLFIAGQKPVEVDNPSKDETVEDFGPIIAIVAPLAAPR